jgi:type II secretory pathway pseudopilin PulG
MNDGGIVAFARGGASDTIFNDDEDDDYEERQLAQEEAEHQGIMAQYQQMSEFAPQGGGGSRVAPAAKTESAGDTSVGKSENINSTPNVEGGIRGVVTEAAKRYGLPPELLQRISGSESGHNPRAKNTASSAEGLFQFIPSTWAGMGGKPGEQSDPVKNADLGGKFIRQNAETLKRQLGRNPNYDEVYAAHYFGPGVTAMLKNATPDMPIEQGLRMFNSEKFVPIIMQQNPNLRGKTVGQVMGSLREKMGDGQVPLADGGITRLAGGGVARFQSAGFVTDEEKRAEEERLFKEKVLRDRAIAEQNNQNPSSFGTLSGGERDKYIAGLGKPKKEADSPAGRFFSEIFDETPEQKNRRIQRENAQRDLDRVNQQFGSRVGATGAFKTQTDQEYENAQTAISQANRNLNAARAGRGYVPPDPYGGNYKPEVRDLQNPNLIADSLYGGTPPSKDFSFASPVSTDQGGGPSSSPTTSSASGVETIPSTGGGTKERSSYDDFMDYFKKGHEDLKSQREEDKYMAILQAGLGMMAGTSPNALANIGQGASAGIANYGASAKQRAAEKNALLKGEITARRYQEMGEDRRSAQRIAEGRYKDALDYRGEKDANELEEKKYKRIQEEQVKNAQLYSLAEARLTTALKDRYPMGSMSPPVNGVKYEDALAAIQNNPQLVEIRRKAFPELDKISSYPTYDPAKKTYK